MNFQNLRRLIAPVVVCLAIAAVVQASPIAYFNSPIDSVQNALNTVIASINQTQTPAAPLVTCTTTLSAANATCNGLRIDPSVSTITTATNGVVSAAVTVNDSSVAAASQVFCQTNGYAGTGTPADVNVVTAAGSFTYQIQNTSVGGAALNQTVPSACMVMN
jgi:hypothetical protein